MRRGRCRSGRHEGEPIKRLCFFSSKSPSTIRGDFTVDALELEKSPSSEFRLSQLRCSDIHNTRTSPET